MKKPNPLPATVVARTAREIGLLIRDRRRKLGLDQATLARRVAVSRQWVIAIERGKASAEIGLVMRTLNALDLILTVGTDVSRADDGGSEKRRKAARRSGSGATDIDAIVDRARERR